MHELSIAMNIVEIAVENAVREQASRITSIELEIGAQSGVVIEALEFAMQSAVKGTMLENAEVTISLIPAVGKCTACGHEFEPDELFSPCPECGNPFSNMIKGKELKVKSLKIE